MPRLWTETIAEHRDAVHEALLDAAGALIHERGLTGLSMAALAERAGIGRATLYRYFPQLDSVLVAWHERHVARHLKALVTARDTEDDPEKQLVSLLQAYLEVARQSGPDGGAGLFAMLHHTPHVAEAEKQLRALLRAAIGAAARNGTVRKDVSPEELADYVFAALASAGGLSAPAGSRLLKVTLDGLRPHRP